MSLKLVSVTTTPTTYSDAKALAEKIAKKQAAKAAAEGGSGGAGGGGDKKGGGKKEKNPYQVHMKWGNSCSMRSVC